MHKGKASSYADVNHNKKAWIVFGYTSMLQDSESKERYSALSGSYKFKMRKKKCHKINLILLLAFLNKTCKSQLLPYDVSRSDCFSSYMIRKVSLAKQYRITCTNSASCLKAGSLSDNSLQDKMLIKLYEKKNNRNLNAKSQVYQMFRSVINNFGRLI